MRPAAVYVAEFTSYIKHELRRWRRRRPRFERTRDAVFEEYEEPRSKFADEFTNGDWTLDEFAVGRDSGPVPLTLSGIIAGEVTLDLRPVRRLTIARLLETVCRYQPRTIVEYGAGTGRNLVWLASQLPGVRCVGYELTPSGVAIGNAAARRFGVDVTMVEADITNEGFAPEPGDVTFTVHFLEQLPELAVARQVIDLMEQQSDRAVVMIEPFPDYWPGGVSGMVHRIRARKFDRLRAGSLDGRNIVSAELLPFGTTTNRAAEVIVVPRR